MTPTQWAALFVSLPFVVMILASVLSFWFEWRERRQYREMYSPNP